MSNSQKAFLDLVRLGIGVRSPEVVHIDSQINWNEIQAIADKQGLSAIVLDGIEKLPFDIKPPKVELLQWIGEVLQSETLYATQQKAAAEMALLFKEKSIRTYVLKGEVIAECYPRPEHRSSVDVDCYLLGEKEDVDAWTTGNKMVKAQGFEVDTDFYKNSTFFLPGLTVENHKFLTPFRGDKRLKRLEIMLQAMLHEDKGEDWFEGTSLYRPPIMVTALFMIEHAYSHFLHEGLTWRQVLDWALFSRKHKNGIDWVAFDALNEEFGFQLFYHTYNQLGNYLLGEIAAEDLNEQDKRMLDDVWADLDLNETNKGVKGKIAMAGNTIKARWKYKYFTDMTMPYALWVRIKGFLFVRHPSLD